LEKAIAVRTNLSTVLDTNYMETEVLTTHTQQQF